MQVRICDEMMGCGKTSAAIRYMNEHEEQRFIYITPFLNEVRRVMEGCSLRGFQEPYELRGSKLNGLNYLLGEKENIVSTHQLFSRYSKETCDLISAGGYTLIMDEVLNVMEPLKQSVSDLDLLVQSGICSVNPEGGDITILDASYHGALHEIVDKAQYGKLFLYGKTMLFWSYPADVFESFNLVIVLTYLFEASILRYYYDANHVPLEYIHVVIDEIGHKFVEGKSNSKYPGLVDKIHIVEHKKLNAIGAGRFALSSGWFAGQMRRGGKEGLVRLKKNMFNLYSNILTAPQEERMWTVFKKAKELCKGRGYTKGFVECTARATNEYRNRTALAYCINIFYNPFFKNHFMEKGIEVDEEKYALSQMVQWIWRSAIRDGEDITIYIPSSRMRQLLKDWLEEVSF
ncbi:MAG: hypothetical protein RR382_08475 [Tannerellaceae bacterium]